MALPQQPPYRVRELPSMHLVDQLSGPALADHRPDKPEVVYLGPGDAPNVIVAWWNDRSGLYHEGQFQISGP